MDTLRKGLRLTFIVYLASMTLVGTVFTLAWILGLRVG